MIIRQKYSRIVLRCVALPVSLYLIIYTASEAASPRPEEELIGLWKSQQVAPPRATGMLKIDGRKSQWQATISGVRTPVQRTGSAIHFVLPNSAGEFRGRPLGQEIVGHWIQPANEINNNRYATPVELATTGQNIWRGKIEPLEAHLTLWMSIQRHQMDCLSSPSAIPSSICLGALFVNRKLGITDNVDEQDVRDLQLNFFLNLSGHPVKLQ